jgi:hypothetical protein
MSGYWRARNVFTKSELAVFARGRDHIECMSRSNLPSWLSCPTSIRLLLYCSRVLLALGRHWREQAKEYESEIQYQVINPESRLS